jgi:hypothetical protein
MTALAKELTARPATMERFGELLQNALAVIDPNRSAAMPIAAATPMPMPAAMPMAIAMPIAPVPIPPTQRASRAPVAPMSMPGAPAKPRNWTPWLVLVGLVGVIGAGVGVYLATQKTAPVATNRAGDTTIAAVDPWASSNEPRDPSRLILLSDDATVDLPAAFTKQGGGAVGLSWTDARTRMAVLLVPLISGTNDPDELSAHWIASNKAFKIAAAGRRSITSLGETRTVGMFTGAVSGVRIYQMVVLYIEPPAFRAALIVQGPADEQNEVEALTESIAADGIHL